MKLPGGLPAKTPKLLDTAAPLRSLYTPVTDVIRPFAVCEMSTV